MALTLLRCVGEVGDWGYFPAPKMQCIGEHTLQYSVVPFDGKTRAEAFQTGRHFAEDRFAVSQLGRQSGALPPQRQTLRIDNPHIALSALKRAENGDGCILRFYNTDENMQDVTLHLGSEWVSAGLTNLAEDDGEALPVNGGALRLPVGAKKIVTIRLRKG